LRHRDPAVRRGNTAFIDQRADPQLFPSSSRSSLYHSSVGFPFRCTPQSDGWWRIFFDGVRRRRRCLSCGLLHRRCRFLPQIFAALGSAHGLPLAGVKFGKRQSGLLAGAPLRQRLRGTFRPHAFAQGAPVPCRRRCLHVVARSCASGHDRSRFEAKGVVASSAAVRA